MSVTLEIPLSTTRHPHEVLQVLTDPPQDERWNDNTNRSDRSASPTQQHQLKWITTASKNEDEDDDMGSNVPPSLGWIQRYFGTLMGGVVILLGTISPILMILAHRLGLPSSLGRVTIGRDCGSECQALLLTLSLKLVVLLGGVWAIFWRSPAATMPRIFFFQSLTLLLGFVASFTFWLFYWVRAEEDLSLLGAIAFAGGLADTLLAVHYLGTLLTQVRHIQPQFQISVLRSPDGIQKTYVIGNLSIQRLAVWILQHYETDFHIFNPHLQRLPPLRRRNFGSATSQSGSSFKFYDFDGLSSTLSPVGRLSSRSARGISHNERFYEEEEFDRRVKKRRARLLATTEEAFGHIRRSPMNNEDGGMESLEAAAAVFPSIARPLQKYLRLTRQQPFHTAESVLAHLATCLRFGLSARTFLTRFISSVPPHTLKSHRKANVASWSLVSDMSVSSGITHGAEFLLRAGHNGDVSLFVQVTEIPHVNLREELLDPKNNKFTLRLGSETSV